MLDRLSRGDEVMVWKLDRLVRNTRNLLERLDTFKARDIEFRSLRDDPEAELERDELSERTRAGTAIAVAKAAAPAGARSPLATLRPGGHAGSRHKHSRQTSAEPSG
ncbi:Resolvase [Sinomonas atrocyanea]|uniref:Resolvase n=1 Tax=Sinomonas atrocyanea TaxID=37927 RepID=A0A126ZX28_9MICC|nr:recombinase family protein [Sinomonas atrocyanea]AMM31653.1 Resolvase [Sinomonas atrocyanea]GEB64195.1 hypothetical protein SAT01_16430 [Sinomonas atrocyanea]GGG57123.1 hypothetical protein GCM10007172_05020 [Sinomonas atrocyanea]